MKPKQLVALFLCALVGWTLGNGLFPLLPVMAARLGAPPDVTGYYLAVSYLALALGTFAAGWVSDTLQRRKLFLLAAGALSIPLTWLMGQASALWQLAVLTAFSWFLGGMGLALVSILAGMSANTQERGKVFGILSFASGLGALLGGITVGLMVVTTGYEAMFGVLALYLGVWVIAALFVEDKVGEAFVPSRSAVEPQRGPGRFLNYLLIATIFLAIGNFVGMFCRSLMMDAQGFNAVEITSTVAVAGVVMLPFPLAAGWLSDRTGRKSLLIAAFAVGTLGLLVLVWAMALWQFWLAISLLFVMNAVAGTLGSALTVDLVPLTFRGRGLAWFSATPWIGAIVGLSVAGVAVQNVGMTVTLLAAALLPLIGIGFLALIHETRSRKSAPLASTGTA